MTDIEITPAPNPGEHEAGAQAAQTPAAPIAAPIDAPVVSVYAVHGMSCGHCASAVTRELSAIEGVTAVQVDLGAKKVTVGSTRELAEDEVRAAVVEAGYELG